MAVLHGHCQQWSTGRQAASAPKKCVGEGREEGTAKQGQCAHTHTHTRDTRGGGGAATGLPHSSGWTHSKRQTRAVGGEIGTIGEGEAGVAAVAITRHLLNSSRVLNRSNQAWDAGGRAQEGERARHGWGGMRRPRLRAQ